MTGLIARVLEFRRTVFQGRHVSDVKVDSGGGDNFTADHFGPSGDDSHPLRGDKAVAIPVPGSGLHAVVGYLDTKNAPAAGPGEKRLYSRDENGDIVASLRLANTGSIHVGTDDANKPPGLAELIDAELARIWNLLSGWKVEPQDGGAALQADAVEEKKKVQSVASERLFLDK